MTLRVAVNLLWCVPGVVGGSEEYLARQLGALREVDPTGARVEPTLFTLSSYPAAHPDLADRYTAVPAPLPGARRPIRVLTEHTWLARRTRRFDLVHHGGGTVPFIGTRPLVLTIHDLQYLDHPEYIPAGKLRYLRATVPRSARRATVIAVPTEFVRGTVVAAFGIDPDRVVVVPHGVPAPDTIPDPIHTIADPTGPIPAIAEVAELRARYRLGDGPVLVYPAITHPHKNHELLLHAMARHWTDPDLRLVLLGGRGTADEAVEATIDRLDLRERVLRPGRVPDADRDGLVAIAEALVFPSTYEGFGAPVVEAMALGTPVVCGEHPAVREVVGDAALALPDEIDAWGSALDEVRSRRAELVAAGRARARAFTPRASAAALLRAYEQAAGGPVGTIAGAPR